MPVRPESILVPQYALWTLGRSAQGRPLDALAILPPRADWIVPSEPAMGPLPWVLLLGTVHGDEPEGMWLIEEMRGRLSRRFACQNIGAVLWARVNPDGAAANARWNGNGVDLNRNLPTKDWTPVAKNPRYPPGPMAASEPENKALVRLIDVIQPRAILTAHSYEHPQVNANGPAREWAERLAAVCGYPITEDIGYPTPGSLGTYAGAELGIPTITLEIEKGMAREKVLALHAPVIEAALEFWDKR